MSFWDFYPLFLIAPVLWRVLEKLIDVFPKTVTIFRFFVRRKLETSGLTYSDEKFLERVVAGDLYAVNLFLRAGMRADTSDSEGNTALILAAWHNRVEVAESLLRKKADVNHKGAYGNTALMAALAKDHDEIACLIQNHEQYRKDQTGANRAELIAAAQRGELEFVKEVIGRPDSNIKDLINAQDLDGNNSLMRATEGGHTSVVKELIGAGADPHAKGKNGTTARQVAALRGSDDIVAELERKGAKAGALEAKLLSASETGDLGSIKQQLGSDVDVNAKNLRGDTGLIIAARRGHLEAVREFISAGSDVNVRDESGRTPILVASEYGQTEIVAVLIQAGANLDAADRSGLTPIMAAILKQHRSIVSILSDAGAVAGADEAYLCDAVELGKSDLALDLIKRGVAVNVRIRLGRTPLIAACSRGDLEIVKALVKAGADVEEPDLDGITPIMAAIFGRHHEVEAFLTRRRAKKGANEARLAIAAEEGDVDRVLALIKDKGLTGKKIRSGRTALIIAAEFGQASIVRELVNCGADPNGRDKDYKTALMIASFYGHANVVSELAGKSDVNAKDRKKRTALMFAAVKGNLEVAQLLTARPDIDLHASNRVGSTALLLAARYGHANVVAALIERSANLNAQDNGGRTALILAAMNGKVNAVQTLLDAGAIVDITDKFGKTALSAAMEGGHSEIERLLLLANAGDATDDVKLIVAIRRNNVERALALIRSGVSVNTIDKRGRSLLMLVIEHVFDQSSDEVSDRSLHDLLDALIRRGANLSAKDRGGKTALHWACAFKRIEIVTRLLAELARYPHETALAQVNEGDSSGKTALLMACEQAFSGAIKPLIDANADCNLSDHAGRTPLMVAILEGHTQIAELLKEHGAWRGEQDAYLIKCAMEGDLVGVQAALKAEPNVEAMDKQGKTALIVAAEKGHYDVVKTLIQANANVNAKARNENSALHLAITHGHSEIVEALLFSDADVNARGRSGHTPLMDASERGLGEVVRALLDRKARVNEKNNDGQTALMVAVAGGHTDVATNLIAVEADVNARDEHGNSALILAVSAGDETLADTLITHGADSNTVNHSGLTPLMAAILRENGRIEQLLRDAGASLGQEDAYLVRAVKEGKLEDVQQLIDRGAKVEARTIDGDTALIIAVDAPIKTGDPCEIPRQLVDAGADVNAKGSGGSTPLLRSAEKGHTKIVEYLVDRKANLNARDDIGSTALMKAAEQNHEEIVRLLLAGGADPNTINKNGDTASGLANSKKNQQIVDLIQDHIARTGSEFMIVYLTRTGGCYHNVWCKTLEKSRIPTILQAATREKYDECSKCFSVTT